MRGIWTEPCSCSQTAHLLSHRPAKRPLKRGPCKWNVVYKLPAGLHPSCGICIFLSLRLNLFLWFCSFNEPLTVSFLSVDNHTADWKQTGSTVRNGHGNLSKAKKGLRKGKPMLLSAPTSARYDNNEKIPTAVLEQAVQCSSLSRFHCRSRSNRLWENYHYEFWLILRWGHSAAQSVDLLTEAQ